MTMLLRSRYAGHRFPPEIISHAIWLYFRFPLSLRMVEEMLAARGVLVSHETVRQWALKFGQAFANQIRRWLPRAGDKWHLDEVVITIAGQKHGLWRSVDQDGLVLDVLVQSRRDQRAAQRLLRKLLRKQGQPPRVLITDKLASYPAAKKELMCGRQQRPDHPRDQGGQRAGGAGRVLRGARRGGDPHRAGSRAALAMAARRLDRGRGRGGVGGDAGCGGWTVGGGRPNGAQGRPRDRPAGAGGAGPPPAPPSAPRPG